VHTSCANFYESRWQAEKGIEFQLGLRYFHVLLSAVSETSVLSFDSLMSTMRRDMDQVEQTGEEKRGDREHKYNEQEIQ